MKSGWALSPAPLPLVCSATWLLSTTQAWSCIAGTVVMVACVKLSKKMPWLKEYGLGIAIVIGIVVGALVR